MLQEAHTKLRQETIQLILGIKKPAPLTPEEMAKHLEVTFFPLSQKVSSNLITFSRKLESAFKSLGIKVIPYEHTLISIRDAGAKIKYLFIFLSRYSPKLLRYKTIIKIVNFLDEIVQGLQRVISIYVPERILNIVKINSYKIKKGIVVIALGENETGNLPIDNTYTFTHNPIVTIIDEPKELKENLSYEEYMEIGLKLFTWHMSNIVITVGEKNWKIFSFNGYSSFYKLYEKFDVYILHDLIPKIATRVSPPRLTEFKLERSERDFLDDPQLSLYVRDLVDGSHSLAQTKLFPPMRKIDTLPFRNGFYRWVAGLHLDERSGMSYGFIARQLPVRLEKLTLLEKAEQKMGIDELDDKDSFVKNNRIYIIIKVRKEMYIMKVPPVWVLMSRSGSQKTRLDARKDIIKIGLTNGQMVMVVPWGIKLGEDYKPSFDTRVILAHCVANAIYAGVLAYFKKDALFPKILERNGVALVHWHGRISPEFIPGGWYVYGDGNPPVLCSSFQSAIYAFKGKENVIQQNLSSDIEYLGDIHIEPQHGINITWETVKGLSDFLISNPSISELNSG